MMAYERRGTLVERKFREYLVPAILTNLAICVTNTIDSAIVGNMLGETALSAIGLSAPIIYFLNAIFLLFAVGGATYTAIAKGRREEGSANSIFTLTIGIGLAVMLVLLASLLVFMQPLTTALAQGDALLADLTRQYLTPTVFVGPAMMLAMGMAHFSRVDGKPRVAAYIAITANLVNLALVLLFIPVLGMGIAGAGLATVIGYSVGFFMLLPYLRSNQRTLHFVKPSRRWLSQILNIMSIGSPKALTQGLSFLRTVVLNTLIVSALGSLGMTAMAVCSNAFMLTAMFINGSNDTILPIAGTLYGEKDYPGIKFTVSTGFKFMAVSSLVMMAVFLLFPGQTGRLFGINSPEGVAIVVPALRTYALCLPLYGINNMLQSLYQTTGRVKLATVIVSLNGFILVTLFAFILTRLADGFLWPAFVLAEAVTLLIVLVAAAVLRKKEGVSGILLLKKQDETESKLDVTIDAQIEAAEGLSDKIIAFCGENGIDNAGAMRIGIAAEEMSVNTALYGHKSAGKGKAAQGNIDVLVRITESELILRLRDDGIPFDPTQYKAGEEHEFAMGGIEVVRRLAKDISYMRQLGFNVIIVTISREAMGERCAALS